MASGDEVRGGFGESGGGSGGGYILLDDLEGFTGEGEAEHGFDEVAAGGVAAAGAKDSAGAKDEGFVVISASEVLPGEFRNAIRTDGTGQVGFDVRAPEATVEDVVGREVDELGIDLTTGGREIAGAEGVGLIGNGGLPFGDVDHVVSGGIQNDGGIDFGEFGLEGGEVGDIYRGPVKGSYGVAAKGEDPN